MTEQKPPRSRESRPAVGLLAGSMVSVVAAIAIAFGADAQSSPDTKMPSPPLRPDADLYCDDIGNHNEFDLGPNDSTGEERSSTFKVALPADGEGHEGSMTIQKITAQVNTAADIGATSVIIRTSSNIIPFSQLRTPESYGIDFNGLAAGVSIDERVHLSLGCTIGAVSFANG